MDALNTIEMNGAISPAANSDVPQVRVPDLERIRNAHKRRMMQLKEWQQYDRKMTRESEKLQRKGVSSPGDKNFYRTGPQVKFPQSLIFLEAAARGDLDEVRKLLSSGVCPDVANEDGLTALHQCCIDNTPEMCRLLLRFGANPNARDTERWTPLHAAATCHHTELCAILIAHGADLLAINADGNMPYECCLPGPTLSLIETEMDKRGITQEELDDLHRLPECEMLADMEALYKNNADLNALDEQGASLLHIAAACGFEEVTIFLLKHGAKIDLLDRDGWQAIHIAACWEHLEIIEILVNFGADILAETTSGETVFDICDDLEMHARLVEIKEEVERKQFQQQDSLNRPEKPRDLVRRRSSTNPRSASIRRTSMREKKMISWKEAKQEAEMRGVAGIELTDGDTPPTNPELAATSESNVTRRVSSPLTVNTSVQQQQQQQQIISKGPSMLNSPTVPFNGRLSSNPQSSPISSSPMISPNTVQSPKSKRSTSNATGSVTHSMNESTSPMGSLARTPLKVSERNSSKPPRTDKSVINHDLLNHISTSKPVSTVDSEHKPNRRTTSNYPTNEGTFTPIPHPRNNMRSVSSTDNMLHVVASSPTPKIRNHLNDRYSTQSGGTLRGSSQSAPSPTVGRRSSFTSRQSKTQDPRASAKVDTGAPNLSAHNAYFNPAQQVLPPTQHQQLPNTASKPGGTLRGTSTRPSRTNLGSTQTDRAAGSAASSLPRKQSRELIENDSDQKASGKCCVIM